MRVCGMCKDALAHWCTLRAHYERTNRPVCVVALQSTRLQRPCPSLTTGRRYTCLVSPGSAPLRRHALADGASSGRPSLARTQASSRSSGFWGHSSNSPGPSEWRTTI